MWLNDSLYEGNPTKIVCVSAPGSHMTWIATIVGVLLKKWSFEDVIQTDGSAHGIKRKLPHYTRTAFYYQNNINAELYSIFVDQLFGHNGIPTIYHDKAGKDWLRFIGEFGFKRKDVLFIPAICTNLQEAIYGILNLSKKNVEDNDNMLLSRLTSTKYPDLKNFNPFEEECSQKIAGNLAATAGIGMQHHAKQYFTMYDIVFNPIHQTLAEGIRNILNIDIEPELLNYCEKHSFLYQKLNQDTWAESISFCEANIAEWPRPVTPLKRVLWRWLLRRRFSLTLPVEVNWELSNDEIAVQAVETRKFKFDWFFDEPEYLELN